MMKYLLIIGLVAEILSIVIVAEAIGGLATLGLMFLFFVAGVAMFRYFGNAAALFSFQMSRLQGGSFYHALYPFRYAIAAMCFMAPGFFSDIIGLALLIPFGGFMRPNPQQTEQTNNPFDEFIFRQNRSNTNDDNIIDGEFSEVTPKDNNHPKLPNE